MINLDEMLRNRASVDGIVAGVVARGRSSVVEALGAVVAAHDASAFAVDVKAKIADIDKAIKDGIEERESMRVQVAAASDDLARARSELDIARRQRQRAMAGFGGAPPDTGAMDVALAQQEREFRLAGSHLTTVSNRVLTAERQKAHLANLLVKLEAVPVADSAVLALLEETLAASG